MHNLDQRIGNIGLRYEGSSRQSSADVHRIRDGGLHRVDAALRSGNHDRRWIGDHLRHAHAARKSSGHPRPNLNRTRLAIIEREVKLAGYDLHHFQILRHVNLPPSQIESPFPRVHAGQIDRRAHVRSLQPVNHALRSPYPDLRFGEAGGIDLQIIGKIMKLNRNLDFDFGDRIARHHHPQADGEQQGNQLEPEIAKQRPLHSTRHRQSSLPGRTPASCLLGRFELGGSSSIKLSSTGLGSTGAGA